MNNEELHLMGNRIHSLMTELKLKNVEVADQISVPKVSVGKWRNGEVQPSSSNFSALVKVLRTTPDYLLSGSGPKQYISIEDRNDNLIFMPSISLDSNASLHTDDFQIAHYDKVILTANDKGREVHRQSNDKVCISNLSANIAGASVADSFSYLIEDDGMSDRVLDGARCVADASKTEIKDDPCRQIRTTKLGRF